VRAVAVSDQTLISASADHTVRVWHLMTGQPLDAPYAGHTDAVWSIAVSGDMVVSGGADSNLLVWNRASQLSTVVGQQAEAVSALALHGNLLASANGNPTGTGDDNAILLWNRDSSGELIRLEGHERSVTSIAYSPDGEQLVSGSVDQTVRIWEVALGTSRVLNGHTDAIMSVTFRPDGEQIASGGFENVIRLWNAAISEPIGDPLTGHSDAVLSVAYSPDGALLASGSFDGTASEIVNDNATAAANREPLAIRRQGERKHGLI
jgi:WD40 repeat protein